MVGLEVRLRVWVLRISFQADPRNHPLLTKNTILPVFICLPGVFERSREGGFACSALRVLGIQKADPSPLPNTSAQNCGGENRNYWRPRPLGGSRK